MNAAPGAISRKWSLEEPAAATGTGAAVLVGLVFALTVGAIGMMAANVGWLLLLWLGWFAVAWLGACVVHGNGIVAGRIAVVGALAWAATMFGVLAVSVAGPGDGVNISHHPAFGEHPVLALVGAPWPGIEGNGLGHASDRIPFSMGIDAMLVNFAIFALLFAAWLRRAPWEQLANLLPLAASAAAVCGLAGGWRLIVLFD